MSLQRGCDFIVKIIEPSTSIKYFSILNNNIFIISNIYTEYHNYY